MEGTAAVRLRERGADDGTAALTPGSAVLAAAGSLRSIKSATATARIELISHTRPGTGTGPDWRLLPSASSSPAWSALASVVNSLFAAPAAPGTAALPLLQLSIENLIAALWVEADETGAARARPEAATGSLYTRALHLIRAHAARADLTMDEIAHELGISQRHLTRIFRTRGTTPGAALRQTRLALARTTLASSPEASLDEVARVAGFPSVRALREAMRHG